MYILVNKKDNVIIGTASQKVSEESAEKSGYYVYEIDNKSFSFDMLGKKLTNFEEIK